MCRQTGSTYAHAENNRYIKIIQYQPGGETFSCFCDSEEQLETLNFLPDTQDLGLSAFRIKVPGSPKRHLPMPIH